MKRAFHRYGLGLIVFSGLSIAGLIFSFLHWHEASVVKAALREAQGYYTLNLHYRAWNATMGGLYASMDKVAPNPYLDVPHREVQRVDGSWMTLINPAYMTRMVFERISKAPQGELQATLISLNPLNPNNSANAWESEALRTMEKTPGKEFFQLVETSGNEFLQYLGPFVTDQSCLKCHAKQGYQEGDLRGAISIRVPMTKHRQLQATLERGLVCLVLASWGVFALLWAALSRLRFDKEMALKTSEQRIRTIFEASQAGIVLVNPRGQITLANRRMAEMFGVAQDALLGMSYPELVSPGERTAGDGRMQQLIAGEIESVSSERHYLRQDGSIFWGHLSGRRMLDAQGRVVAVVGVISDLSELKNAVDEINRAKDYFFSILNSIADPVFVKDDRRRLVLVNDAFCRLLGKDRTCLLEHREPDFLAPDQLDMVQTHDELVLSSGEPQSHEQEMTDALGRVCVFLAHRSAYVDPDGKRFIVVALRDMTEQKSLQHQTMRAAQMAAVGQLASGVAHEINNPITGVINCAQLLISRQAVAEDNQPILDRIIREGDRIAKIVKSLLFCARDSGDKREPADLQDLLVDVLHLSRDQLGHDQIDLQLSLSDSLPVVSVNPQQFEQVILNLISNARHALNERGCADPAPKILRIATDLIDTPEGLFCRVSVYDNGTGIPSGILERLGRPFVTTKPAGVGTGLGLSVSMEIVKRFDGALTITSEPGKFTEVQLTFPAVSAIT